MLSFPLWASCCTTLVFCVVFCRSLFILLPFFFWLLHCLFFCSFPFGYCIVCSFVLFLLIIALSVLLFFSFWLLHCLFFFFWLLHFLFVCSFSFGYCIVCSFVRFLLVIALSVLLWIYLNTRFVARRLPLVEQDNAFLSFVGFLLYNFSFLCSVL